MEMTPGQRLGAYRVIRLLGKGGMGAVYEVEHVQLGVHYAILLLICAGMAGAAFDGLAMPTEEAAARAEPVVQELLESDQVALASGKKTRTQVADAAMELAAASDSEAAKMLLMKGAVALYVRDGNLEKAVETVMLLPIAR